MSALILFIIASSFCVLTAIWLLSFATIGPKLPKKVAETKVYTLADLSAPLEFSTQIDFRMFAKEIFFDGKFIGHGKDRLKVS